MKRHESQEQGGATGNNPGSRTGPLFQAQLKETQGSGQAGGRAAHRSARPAWAGPTPQAAARPRAPPLRAQPSQRCRDPRREAHTASTVTPGCVSRRHAPQAWGPAYPSTRTCLGAEGPFPGRRGVCILNSHRWV